MLTKLLKHEFLTTARTMPILYAAMLLTAGAGRVINLFAGEYPQNALLIMLNFVKIMNQLIIWLSVLVTLVIIIQRFYKSALGSEGYLTMSLPVSKRSLLYSKLIVSLFWSAATYCVATLTYWIYNQKLPEAYKLFFSEEAGAALNIMTAVVLLTIVSCVICAVYLSVSVGHLFKSKTPLLTIVSFAGVFAVVGGVVYLVYNFDLLNSLFSFLGEELLMTLNIYGIPAIFFFLILSVGCFEASNYILSKRLNLVQ